MIRVIRKKKQFKKSAIGVTLAVCLITGTLPVHAKDNAIDDFIEESQVEIATENSLDLVEAMEQKQEEEARLERQRAAQEEAEARRQRKLEQQRKEEEARLEKRQELVNFALQFVGNPYVYGGTSLTNGADCSGFVQSVFANFGYSLPRVADAQAYAGQEKSMDCLEAGDLLFYGGRNSIYHVAIYMGNGQVVHASTAATGIKVSEYNYNEPCMAVTYLA